jgi:hypothetical protein
MSENVHAMAVTRDAADPITCTVAVTGVGCGLFTTSPCGDHQCLLYNTVKPQIKVCLGDKLFVP